MVGVVHESRSSPSNFESALPARASYAFSD